MLRRPPFGIPKAGQVAALVALLAEQRVEPSDADEFRDAVVAHRVTGFADSAIEAGRLLVPDQTARELRDAHAFTTLRSGLLRRELMAIAPLLAKACGTEPLVFKGPAAAETLYQPRTLRPFTDLDLLVPRSRIEAAAEALGALGYRPNLHLRPGFAERYRHDVHLSRRDGKRDLGIDLHWRVSDDPLGTRLSHEAIESVRIEIDGTELACPSPADHLIVLSLHFLGDRLRRLIWIEDLRRAALAADDEQWRLAFERAEERDVSWVLHRALDYAAHHLNLVRERPAPPGPRPPWGPLRATEAFEFAVAWDVGLLTSIPWRERPGYLRALLLPTREGLRGAAADRDTPIWRLALRRARRAFTGLGSR